MSREQFVWSEKYRPTKVADVILPKYLKEQFQGYVDQKAIPNLLLVGAPGIGKTTIAEAMLKELGCNYMIIPSSLRGDMDTLRNEIATFASTVSFTGGRKYIILDEADYLTWRTQPALRNFMQDYAANCGFILTANYLKNIIPALQSRCPPVQFDIPKEEIPILAKQFLKRVCEILDIEKVEYDKAAVVDFIVKFFPDWRRVLNELQNIASKGKKITKESLVEKVNVSLTGLIDQMKAKNFTAVRQWVAENIENDVQVIFKEFYVEAKDFFDPSYIPELVMLIARYQYQASFATDAEINLAAFMVEVMVGAIWK